MGKYAVFFFDICFDEPTYSKGSAWISENSKGAKWLSKFLAQNPSNREYNIKANAYLMDTNIWNVYSGEKAEYAMGGTTLELYCASYKDTHPHRYIENEVDSVGYKVKWNSSYSYSESISGLSTSQSDYNNIYIKSIGSEAIGMWIATPSSYDPQDSGSLVVADYSGNITNKKINGGAAYALRPLVCLSSNVQIEDLEDGTYQIK